MNTRKTTTTLYYVIAFMVILVAFLLLGGGPWIKGMAPSSGSMGMSSLRWGQILISVGLGFLLGWLTFRRKW